MFSNQQGLENVTNTIIGDAEDDSGTVVTVAVIVVVVIWEVVDGTTNGVDCEKGSSCNCVVDDVNT